MHSIDHVKKYIHQRLLKMYHSFHKKYLTIFNIDNKQNLIKNTF